MTPFDVIFTVVGLFIACVILDLSMRRKKKKKAVEPVDDVECNCCANLDTEHTRSCPRYTIGVRKLLRKLLPGSRMMINGLLVGRPEKDWGDWLWVTREGVSLSEDAALTLIYEAAFKPQDKQPTRLLEGQNQGERAKSPWRDALN